MPAALITRPRAPARPRPRPFRLRLSGSITALATPFTAAGELDLDAWRRLLQQQLDGGTQALVVAGSTGEAASLYGGEFDALLRTAVEFVAGRVPVLAGTGQANTAKTIEQTRRAAALGADAALVVAPAYVRPTQDGLLQHYGAIADEFGSKGLSQRVGQSVGHNPLSVIVPCHRVLGADGSLTGYAGGLDRKRALLALEEPDASEAGRLF